MREYTFQVTVVSTVEAEDEEEAYELAADEINEGLDEIELPDDMALVSVKRIRTGVC